MKQSRRYRAGSGLSFGLSPAGQNFGNSGPTGSGFKREMHRQVDREIDRHTDRQKEYAGRQINRWTERETCLLNT